MKRPEAYGTVYYALVGRSARVHIRSYGELLNHVWHYRQVMGMC